MSYVLLEARLRDHPKAIAAGPEAMWLYVCGLLWADEQSTGGRLPGVQGGGLLALSPTLSWQKAQALARRLVRVGLWEPDGAGFRVHDFEHYNRSASEAAQEREILANRRAADRLRKQRQRARETQAVT
jgi:hypothetical protein